MNASKTCSRYVQLIASTTNGAHGVLSLGLVAMLLWSIDSAGAVLVNGDFETGDFTGWTLYTTNGAVGTPAVTLFDTSHSGTPSHSARFQAGDTAGDWSQGGGGLFQNIFVPLQGSLTLALDAASYSSEGPNGEGGLVTLFFDHTAVASLDFGAIGANETKYGHLAATIPTVATGTYELRIQVTRAALTTWYTPYQYIDNVTIGGTAIPEPATWSLLVLGAVALLGGCRMRRLLRQTRGEKL